MTKVRLTDPHNMVQVAFHRIGSYEDVAKLTKTALSTVKQWRYTNNIPLEHIPTISQASKIDPFVLYSYVKKHANVPKSKEKPTSVIDALLEDKPTGLSEKAESLLRARNSPERLRLMKQLFQRISQHYDSQSEYICAIDACAQALSVKRDHFFRLMRQFSVKRQEFGTQQREKAKRQTIDEKRRRQRDMATAVIKGVITAKDGATQLDIAYRHFFRIIEALLTPYPGYQVNTLRSSPRLLRLAIGNEIETGAKPLTLKLKALYDAHYNAKRAYQAPEDLVHAPFKDKIIAVLDGEITLDGLSSATGIAAHDLKTFFNHQLRLFSLSFDEIYAASPFHQAFLADILKHSDY